jgi:hypothetical protein
MNTIRALDRMIAVIRRCTLNLSIKSKYERFIASFHIFHVVQSLVHVHDPQLTVAPFFVFYA